MSSNLHTHLHTQEVSHGTCPDQARCRSGHLTRSQGMRHENPGSRMTESPRPPRPAYHLDAGQACLEGTRNRTDRSRSSSIRCTFSARRTAPAMAHRGSIGPVAAGGPVPKPRDSYLGGPLTFQREAGFLSRGYPRRLRTCASTRTHDPCFGHDLSSVGAMPVSAGAYGSRVDSAVLRHPDAQVLPQHSLQTQPRTYAGVVPRSEVVSTGGRQCGL